jgi:anti-sigma regulatory factor (Ser/Thr protein kinase)/GNAT superfamily N-acetyltransferase
MQLELLLSNESRVLPSVRAFAHEALAQLPLSGNDAEQLAELVVAAVENAVEHAYRSDEEGSVKLVIQEKHGLLEIRVRDYGIPQDVESLERQLHAPELSRSGLFGCHTAGLVDEMHWLAFGPQGKALQLRKWLHVHNISDTADAGEIAPFREDAALAPPQEYEVRPMQPADAVGISQLMYRAYGGSYFNADVYYPERVAARNAHGTWVSFVALTADGHVAGHYALEMSSTGPVAETGQAVVDPAHRGRGLLGRLKELALAAARQRDLVGWYADAVTVHTLTQQSNRDHGGTLSCVDLAVSPKSEVFHGFPAQQQRVTCLVYFHWIQTPQPQTIYVPKRYREITATLYEHLQRPVQFGTAQPPTGHGALQVKFDAGAAKADITVEVFGADTVVAVRHAKRELVERSRAEAVFLDLPLNDSASPYVAEALETDGFAFAGVVPHLIERGDIGRFIYLVEPLAREPIKTLAGFESQFVDYVLAEQRRVQDA